MNLIFKLIGRKDLTQNDKDIFATLLDKQGKVRGDLRRKAERCKLICLVYKDDIPIAIGGIKPKSASVFNPDKANLPHLSLKFQWELGYVYTDEKENGKGIASFLIKLLLSELGSTNLMATTEIEKNPSMAKILEKNGFKPYGTIWDSSIHSEKLGLFLKIL